MNKNKKVAKIEIENNSITAIHEMYNLEYAPLSVVNAHNTKGKTPLQALNNWFLSRKIPSWRKDIENLLISLNITCTEELLTVAYGLSLSDQYWIKEESQNVKWEDINFFTNEFKYKVYLQASLNSNKAHNLSTSSIQEKFSPNNTTDGMVQKAWIIENNKRVLVKGSYSAMKTDPINEWLASCIAKKLNINCCHYSLDIVEGKLVSKVDCFINENEEEIKAYDIFMSEKKDNQTNDLNHYINLLTKHGIKNAEDEVKAMFMLDFIIMNKDRHMFNFGIIRNVETLKWERIIPIYDNGESMCCEETFYGISFKDSTGRFFSNAYKPFSEILDSVSSVISKYDFTKLDGIDKEYETTLNKYKYYINLNDETIKKLVEGLRTRINLIKEKQKQLATKKS